MQQPGINDFNASTIKDAVEGPNKKNNKQNADSEAAQKPAKENYAAYVYARDNGHIEYVEKAKRFDDLYMGEHWDKKDKQELESVGRPALTLNKILAVVNAILGVQISREADIKFVPVKDATQSIASALNKLYLHVKNQNNIPRLMEGLFADGIIQERGFLDVRMDTDTNIQGDIDISLSDPVDTWLSPGAKEYDPSTWPEVGTTRWMSPGEILDEYGEEAFNKVRSAFGEYTDQRSLDYDSVQLSSNVFGGDSQSLIEVSLGNETQYVKSIRIIDREYKKSHRCYVAVDPESGDREELPRGWNSEKRGMFAERFGLIIQQRTIRKIRWTVSAGENITIHDKWSPYRSFTKIPYFPYFRRGRPFGVIRNLEDPQMQYNKTQSQILHIVNTTANSGWIVEEGALVNMDTDELRRDGAKTGIVITTAPGRGKDINKIQPNQIPTGLDRFSDGIDMNIRQISAVNEAMLGDAPASRVSGVVLERNFAQGVNQLEKPFANLHYTEYLLANKILELLQDFYTERRLFNIITDFTPSDGPETEELVINDIQTSGEIANDITLGKYAVVITSQPSRETYQDSQFAHAMELRNAGVNVPDEDVIQTSRLSNKDQIAEKVSRLSGTAAPTEEEMAELVRQQEISAQFQMLELQKLAAEIQEIGANTEAKLARASADAGEHARLLDELENEIQKKREEYNLRFQLATMAARSKERIASEKHFFDSAERNLDRIEERLREVRGSQQDKPSVQNRVA